ncbi:hypothetical protein [Amycolatopsis vancoresmycina]|uniref:Uncharacterized protein n=1 Tax=Amycolatopsis vancoresmycina DSM 44592 TaxID=1292037 RepID=R1I9D7_9PSEU|nr:hypothetical protein [Amycolatopsis vancoresmycina]EOD69161.1 hypothetical protein H480_07578 [Amycolatopsis vancoresmycina DSM 44592]
MSDEPERTGEEQLVHGVPAHPIVDALRSAGVAEDDVVAVLGRAIARQSGAGLTTTVTPPFVFQTTVPQVAPQCEVHFEPSFTHPDFVDGVTVVQAGETPTEIGFNRRFHAIEDDLADIADALRTVSNCMKELRLELFGVVQELQVKITALDRRIDPLKDKAETKETKEKEKEKEGKDTKEKEGKDDKEKEKEIKEKEKDKEKEGEKDGSKEFTELAGAVPPDPLPPASEENEGGDRTFISLADRPDVGRNALADPEEDS